MEWRMWRSERNKLFALLSIFSVLLSSRPVEIKVEFNQQENDSFLAEGAFEELSKLL
jgi:hypothetical protein